VLSTPATSTACPHGTRSADGLEVFDHKQDLQEAKDEADLGTNRRIGKEAKTEIPTLKEHLRLAREALAAVGGNG
jgi:hypothetical protein